MNPTGATTITPDEVQSVKVQVLPSQGLCEKSNLASLLPVLDLEVL